MIEGNENNDLENLEELDDITAVDLALKLSEYDDDELEELEKLCSHMVKYELDQFIEKKDNRK